MADSLLYQPSSMGALSFHPSHTPTIDDGRTGQGSRVDGAGERSCYLCEEAQALAHVGSWVTELPAGSSHWSKECCRIFGVDPSTPTTADFFLSRVHPEDRERVRAVRDELLERGLGYEQEHRIVRLDNGEVRTVSRRATIIRDERGNPLRIVGVMQDVTEQRRGLEALKVSELRYRRLVDSGIVAVAIADLSGTIYEANEAYLCTFKFTRADLLAGRIDWTKMTPPEWRHTDEAAIEQLRDHGSATPWEKELIAKDGTRIPVLLCVAMLDENRCMAVVTNRTKGKHAEEALRRSEEQLRQAQKMESIGLMAGGIAHDFNNILSVILSYSALVLEDLPADAEAHTDLQEIHRAGQRAAELTRHLLAFSRRQLLQPRVLDLNQTIAGMEKMLRRLLDDDIVLSIEPSRSLPRVHADPGQVEQVIMNLAINARDAMPRGGKLTLTTAATELDIKRASELGLGPGPFVALSVTDTGTGMDAETKSHVFEPFFTTKAKDRGTGLGLSTVFGIVQQSGGSVSLESQLGKGSTFTIFLPRAGEGDDRSATRPPAATRSTASGTVLVVEDDESVRNLVLRILRHNGYTVLEAQNGGEALLHCEQHEGPIDLLLTDVVMPRMDGPRVAERLLKSRPEMGVLYMSGHADKAIRDRASLTPGSALLLKPITPNELLRKVHSILDVCPHS